jgi:hypothetical protein
LGFWFRVEYQVHGCSPAVDRVCMALAADERAVRHTPAVARSGLRGVGLRGRFRVYLQVTCMVWGFELRV